MRLAPALAMAHEDWVLSGRLERCAIGTRTRFQGMCLAAHPHSLDVELAPAFRQTDGMGGPGLGRTGPTWSPVKPYRSPVRKPLRLANIGRGAGPVGRVTRVLVRLEERLVDEVAVAALEQLSRQGRLPGASRVDGQQGAEHRCADIQGRLLDRGIAVGRQLRSPGPMRIADREEPGRTLRDAALWLGRAARRRG